MSELIREIVVQASPATIYPYLVDPDLLVKWMGTEVELDPQVGGVHHVLVGGRHPSLGRFIELVPDERVVFSFGWDEPGHPIPAGSTEIEISLVPDGEKTRVRLVHRGLPDDAVDDHIKGWDHYLSRLETVVGGGHPGPDVTPADS